jgi:photosystem II stability/assembly factor-like uncharacterized protein
MAAEDENVPATAIDAPLDERAALDAWITVFPPTGFAEDDADAATAVAAAGRPPRAAPGPRAARPVADVAAFDAGARGNWIPTGPRNITGRVRAFAVHPTDPTIMYAGVASGGVFKSTDGGDTWTSSWRDDASQSIAGISICRDHPDTVWVATGEIQAGGSESILGSGVYRSSDAGATWKPDNPVVPGTDPNRATTFDGIAAHPTDVNTCWTVGPAGVFRTTDGGATWLQFETGIYYSDVAFSVIGAVQLVVFLVRARSFLGEATVLRIDNPDAAEAAVRPSFADTRSASTPMIAQIAPPAPAAPLAAWPARGKIAICTGTPAVAYLRLVDGNGRHLNIFRTQNAQDPQPAAAGAASAIQWFFLFDGVSAQPTDAGFADDGQGLYDLAIGVNAANASELATGMLNVHVSLNANNLNAGAVTWKRVMCEDLLLLDRAQHGDIHTTMFVQPPGAAPAGTPPTLWVTSDGGISSSTDWRTSTAYPRGQTVLPLPGGVTTWRKSLGISGSQMYSLSQSPLLPTVFGCGFQDNGTLMTTGGPTWRFVIGADGGFLAFDPDDPYTMLATWQRAIDEVHFPGRLEGGFAIPGYPAREGIWPRQLSQGFLDRDGPRFVADTAHHPLRGDRILHARLNRLYGSTETTGDRWQPEAAGRSFEIEFSVAAVVGVARQFAFLEVMTTDGAAKLGLAPQLAVAGAAAPATAVAVVRSTLPGPYALADGDTIQIRPSNAPPPAPVPAPAVTTVTFRRNPDKAGVPWTAAEVAAEITRQAPAAVSRPCFWARPFAVEITTTALGANAQITLDGSALTPGAPPNDLSPLGVRARTYHGSAGRPATATLLAPNVGRGTTSTMAVATGQPPLELGITIGAGGTRRTVTFDANTFVDLRWIHAGELEQAIKAALGADAATVTAVAVRKRLLVSDTSGAGLALAGTAGPRMNFIAVNAPTSILCDVLQPNTFNLAPAAGGPATPLVLTINGGTNPSLTFSGAANDLRAMTAEELQATLNAHFARFNIRARCDLTFFHGVGFPSEIVYSRAAPDTAWVGSTDGTLYKTVNDGGRWDAIQDPALRRLDRQVEALAIHPTDAQTVYAGLDGRPTSGNDTDQVPVTKPGLLFKTTDGGASWIHVGADVKAADGGLLGVYALQIDPDAPDTVFAATEVGVFRTIDGGASWQPFNDGLPPGIVRDLDFVPERRVLRAGVWGRGTYERNVGGELPKDVSLYVRANAYDNGASRPAPRGPDLLATVPQLVGSTQSPDIKVNRDLPAGFAPATFIDGVVFDDDIAHEDVARGDSFVFVQAHNRGAFAATQTRIACLWADVSAGPPQLPADFWTRWRAGALAGDLGGWTLIHDTRGDGAGAVRDVRPGQPVVQALTYHWPDDTVTHRRIGILALVESAEDQLSPTQLDVGELLLTEAKAAYRESATLRDHDDQTILIRQTSAVQFAVGAPGGALIDARPALFQPPFPPGAVASIATLTQATFALPPGPAPPPPGVPPNQAVQFGVPAQTVTVNFGTGIFDPQHATPAEVATIIRHALIEADVPVTVTGVTIGAGVGIQLNGVAGCVLQVTGGAAAATLGLPAVAAGPQVVGTVAGTWDLSVGTPQTLVLSITKQTSVQFGPQPGFNAAAASARSLRRLLNREFAAAHLPIRAVASRVDLWIRRSITDVGGRPSAVAGRGLADIVAAPAPVAPLDRPGLFDLVKAHGPGPVHASADNSVYVRVANLGTADLAEGDSRHRLYAVAIGATPVAIAQIGGDLQQTVPAGSSAIVEFTWNPGAAAAGDRLFVLAVSDDKTHAALEPPTTFPSVDALDTFCASNPGAAYRMFVVGA